MSYETLWIIKGYDLIFEKIANIIKITKEELLEEYSFIKTFNLEQLEFLLLLLKKVA